MATYEGIPGPLTYIQMVLAKRISARKERSNRLPNILQTLTRLVLHIAGFSCLTYAGFQWNIIAGMITAGISCFIFSWLFASASEPRESPPTGIDPMASRR